MGGRVAHAADCGLGRRTCLLHRCFCTPAAYPSPAPCSCPAVAPQSPLQASTPCLLAAYGGGHLSNCQAWVEYAGATGDPEAPAIRTTANGSALLDVDPSRRGIVRLLPAYSDSEVGVRASRPRTATCDLLINPATPPCLTQFPDLPAARLCQVTVCARRSLLGACRAWSIAQCYEGGTLLPEFLPMAAPAPAFCASGGALAVSPLTSVLAYSGEASLGSSKLEHGGITVRIQYRGVGGLAWQGACSPCVTYTSDARRCPPQVVSGAALAAALALPAGWQLLSTDAFKARRGSAAQAGIWEASGSDERGTCGCAK